MKKMIFGVGKTLYNNWRYIEKYYAPDLAIDNNPDLWGKIDEVTGLACISPNDLLLYMPLEILITVGDPYSADNISSQLSGMGIKPEYLIEKIKEWSAYELLPSEIYIQNENKKIWLVNTPEHDNLGDHLIAKSELELIKKLKLEREVVEVTDMDYLWHREKLKNLIKPNDVIVITGGGFLGSMWLYNGENTVREIITDYPNNKIIIFPQTVYFENNDRGKKEFLKSSKTYKNHDNLVFCLREKRSYDLLKSFMPDESKLHLLPDMGLFLKYNDTTKRIKGKIAFCLRSDKESILSANAKNKLIQTAGTQSSNISFISTHSGDFEGKKNREEQIRNKMNEIASYSLIITDTLHCMIFAAICGTPCIAIDNLSQKVSNVYEWIKDLQYMRLCTDLAKVNVMINELMDCPGRFILKDRDKYEVEIKSIL